jgi:hypothetical protein
MSTYGSTVVWPIIGSSRQKNWRSYLRKKLERGYAPVPTGPKGEKRPADVIGNAVKVMRILTGEEPEDYGSAPAKDQAAQALGRKGGKKRAERMTAEQRAEIARAAASARWKKGD